MDCSRDGTGSEPLTRDLTRPGRFWPGDPTQSLSVCALNWKIVYFIIKIIFDDGVLLVNAFCQKSLVYAAHIQVTNAILSDVISRPWSRDSSAFEFILSRSRSRSQELNKGFDNNTGNTRIRVSKQDMTDYTESHRLRILLTKSNDKARAKQQNRVRHRVCHTDPWSDPTRPKSLTRVLVLVLWVLEASLADCSDTANNPYSERIHPSVQCVTRIAYKRQCQSSDLYTALSLAAQCIVIGPACGFVCMCVFVYVWGLLPW